MPSLPPPVWAELSYDGTFNSITDDLHVPAAVSVTRGRGSERDSAGPSQGSMTLLNTNAKYSRRNPNSELFGQVGLNTPIRYGYDTVGSVWAESTGVATSYLSTPSSASYNITGDLDVRAEIAADSWTASIVNIANRYDTTTNSRSWSLQTTSSGRPELYWSVDGTAPSSATATAYLPAHAGQRIALRATLDVANTDGIWEVRFYTALSVDSAEDDWKLLGTPVFGATSTSVFDPARQIEFGARSTSVNPGLNGRLYRLQLRGGIGGSVLLDVDTSLADEGDTSFQDANGITWTANSVTFTRRHVRFHGEVPDWTPLRDKSGNFKTVSIAPAGISRRLSSGAKVLRSPLFREMSNPARQNIVAYWPLEDSSDALSLASGLVRGRPGAFSGDVSLAADSTSWLSSDPLPTWRTGKVALPVTSYTDTGQMSLRFLLAVPSAGVTANGIMARLVTSGTVRVWELGIRTDGSLRVTAYDADGTQLADNIIAVGNVNGATVAITFEVSVSGSTITRRLLVTPYVPGQTVNDPSTANASSATLTGTSVGRVTSLQLGDGTADLGGIVMGHPAIATDLDGFAATGHATIGWNGEAARSRLLRLAAEENVPLSVAMDDPERPQMGVQQSSTFLDLIRQVETVDQGLLFERRDGIELAYRSASTLLNQEPVLVLDFEDGIFDDIRPKDDDRAAFNVMTAKRITGSEFTYELTEGANSTQDPPDGIGYYSTSVDLSLASDDDLPDQAAWRVHVATVDEMRYPTITLNLANERTFALLDDILRVDVGDKIRLTNLPPDYSVDDVDLLVWGPSEAPGPDSWPVSFTCVPAEPWNAGVLGSSTYGRVDTAGSQTTAAVTSSQTTIGVLTTAEMRWVWTSAFASAFPFDVRAGGEVWRVTACTPSVYDTFTRTATGWGTADSGQTWTGTGGVAGDHFTQGSRGVHRMTAVSSAIRDWITAAGTDHDVRMSVSTDQLATGGDQYVAAAARVTDENNLYMAQLQFSTAAAVTLSLRKRVASVETVLGTWSGGVGAAHTALGRFFIRLQVRGSTIRCRAWAAATTEPSQWQIIATDTSLTTGSLIGARSVRTSGNTNANLLANWDDVELLNPQTFTVTRSVNGVSKAHDAGTGVRLARPVHLSF